jgi:asparagine synthase (glutamine-hydrolysing)
MVEALMLEHGERTQSTALGSSAMGLAQRWQYQQLWQNENVLVATDADCCNLKSVAAGLGIHSPQEGSLSVCEIIYRLYLSSGLEFIKSLEGNFSLALWDLANERLVLAIDSFAVKNLYWALDRGTLLFASRAGAVRTGHSSRLGVSESALAQFLLFSSVPAPLSIYTGIHRLEPGHLLLYERGQVSMKRYWDLDYVETEARSEDYWVRELREGIRGAVQRTLAGSRAETTGAYLSGGTDSSSVVAFLSEECSPANTFSIAFSETKYNEIEYARVAAREFKTRHSEYVVTPEDAFDCVPKLISYFDEPFANSSAIGGYYCARVAREHGMELLLAGDGGDEIFAGNERYASDKRFQIYQSLPRFLRRTFLEPAVSVLPKTGPLSLPARYIRRANIPNPRRVISYGMFLSTAPEDVFEPEFLKLAPADEWLEIAERHHHSGIERSELNRMMYTDIKMTLGDNDLRKVSGSAELAGVSVRYPLLDRKLVELAARIPSGLKMKGFAKRYIFKKAMQGVLPEQILRKTKHGFGVPVSLWLLQNPRLKQLTLDVLNDRRTRQRGYFRVSFFDRLLDLHKAGHTSYYGEVVWYMLVLEMWHREHLEKTREVVCVG